MTDTKSTVDFPISEVIPESIELFARIWLVADAMAEDADPRWHAVAQLLHREVKIWNTIFDRIVTRALKESSLEIGMVTAGLNEVLEVAKVYQNTDQNEPVLTLDHAIEVAAELLGGADELLPVDIEVSQDDDPEHNELTSYCRGVTEFIVDLFGTTMGGKQGIWERIREQAVARP